MAISYGEIWAGRTSKHNRDNSREHTRVFIAVTDDPTLDGYDLLVGIAADALAIARAAAHPSDPKAYCVDVSPVNISEDRLQWVITATYTTSLGSSYLPPTSRPTRFRWSTEFVEKAIAADLDDYLILNSAYDTFNPPASVRVPIDVITATSITASYTPATDKDPYVQHVNSAPYTIGGRICPIGTCILDDLTVEEQEELGVWYNVKSYTFKVRRDLWTETATALDGAVTAGSAVVLTLDAVTGIVVGTELEIVDGTNTEVVRVTSTTGLTATVATLAHNHADNKVVKIRTYNPWQYRPLDAGFNYYDTFNNRQVEIYVRMQRPQNPVLLDGLGGVLDVTTGTPDPVYLDYRIVPSVDFNAITMP